MNKSLRHITQDIQNNRLLEENIPQLFNYMADHYKLLSEVRLSMHYFTFYEAYYDDEDTWSVDACNTLDRINQLIRDNYLKSTNGLEREAAVKEINSIRQEIIRRMSVLTAYTDIFQNFEYLLNRLEYRFKKVDVQIDDIEFSKEVLRFIFDSEDNVLINEKIKDIIGQLPIRMTKQKYFEIIKESLGAYLGADDASLDNFLFMLRTSAMLYSEKGMEVFYPTLWEKKEFLLQLDYKDITKENYEKALSLLQAATIILETETNLYFGLQEIVNEFYTLLLCAPYSGMVVSDTEKAQKAAAKVLYNINELFLSKKKSDIFNQLMESLTDLEGVQEELAFELDLMESSFYEISKNHRALTGSLMLEQLFKVLSWSQNLLSNSLFIEFEEERKETTVDEERIEREAKALFQELSGLFAGYDRMISRCVIANTINKVPVFFQNHKEVMDYVTYSLERCSDPYEKAACKDIIGEIMQA